MALVGNRLHVVQLRGGSQASHTAVAPIMPALPTRGRARLRSTALDGFAGEPDCQAAALAQAGVMRAPVRELALLFGNMASMVLVQLERQDGQPKHERSCLRQAGSGRHLAGPGNKFAYAVVIDLTISTSRARLRL